MGRVIFYATKEKCAKFFCSISSKKRILIALFGILFFITSYITSAQTTVFTLSQPVQPSSSQLNNDGQAIELGMKFQANTSGYITDLRFYKAEGNNGTHIGQLWSSTGTLLAQATYTNETISGWQQVALSSPIAVTAGATYIVAYHSSAGYYNTTYNFFSGPIVNEPLTGLANGTDGPNGLYRYTNSPAFPNSSYQSSNYWVDVVFNTVVGPDITAPTINTIIPLSNAIGVSTSATITATISEGLDANSVNTNSVYLFAGANLIPATVLYNATNQSIELTPSSALQGNTFYTVTIKGGITGIKDMAGNALENDYVWNFTTAVTPPVLPDPNEGPGGPILVISSSSNPFSRYAVEILRAEGLNEFSAMDISAVTASVLNNYDVVILGEMPLDASDADMLINWVNTGGNLIAFRPDAKLYGLMGIISAGGTLSDKYLLVNTTSGAGVGIVSQTMQFHGTADQYNLNGAIAIATLFSSATTSTPYPAVTTRNVGSDGGTAVAFSYDLAKSIVYTRQGNPDWAGQNRDGQSGPIRADNQFFPDWIDFNKVAIPQADEQQRLLTNIIIQGNLDRKPLPRFWFLPRKLKAAIVMTGDDHNNGGTVGRFNQYLGFGNNSTQDVADWRAIRGTTYIFPDMSSTLLSDAQAASFQSQGFEIALHVNTGCVDYSESSLLANFTTQLATFASNFPSLSTPVTHRIHCLAWSDWASKPKVESSLGVRLNADYYYWPASWVQDRPGMFTGSGMPMRFADLDGTLIDNYQLTTQLTDESGISFTNFINTLLDNAKGPSGYYGVFCANMHTDYAVASDTGTIGSNAIIASAQAHQIPVISAKQMLTWLDGRNNSSYSTINWNSNILSFTITAGTGAYKLQGMVPVKASGYLQLAGITYNGSPVSYTTEMIKGINYAFFDANNGDYDAIYIEDISAPVISNVLAVPNSDGTAVISWTTNENTDSKVEFGTVPGILDQFILNDTLTTGHSITINGLTQGVTYYFRVTSVDEVGNSTTVSAPPADPLSFIIPCSIDGTLQLSGTVCAGKPINLKFIANNSTAPFALTINNNLINNVADNAPFNSGIQAIPVTEATIWPSSTVGGDAETEIAEVELGVKFRSAIPGFIKGIRFYKTIESGTGTFSTYLYNQATGNLLGTAIITINQANVSGWQQANFITPIQIDPNTTYVASYHTNNGRYSFTSGFFSINDVTNGPLTALRSGVEGENGVFKYGSGGIMPTSSFSSTNYWVDVVFNPANVLTLSKITNSDGCITEGPNLQTLALLTQDCSISLPVSLVEFKINTKGKDVILDWSTSSESNNKGFEIERSMDGQSWTRIGFVKGAGNSQLLQKYQFTDPNLRPGKYFYRLKQTDFDGRFTYSKVVFANIYDALSFALDQNYPNPAHQTTVISYTVPNKMNVDISLFDMHGRLIKNLIHGFQDAGSHTFSLHTEGLQKGVYFYKMQTSEFATTRKLIIE